MRTIIIDPKQRTIEAIETDGSLAAIHRHVGDKDGLDSTRIAAFLTSWDYIWLDDRGLERGEPIWAFRLDNRDTPMAGNALIIGVDQESRDNCDAAIPLAFLKEHVIFLGLIRPEVVWESHEHGQTAHVSYEVLNG